MTTEMYNRYRNGEFGNVMPYDNTPKGLLIVRDGDAFMILGPTFTNIQDSDDYAFGESVGQAFHCYVAKKQGTKVLV